MGSISIKGNQIWTFVYLIPQKMYVTTSALVYGKFDMDKYMAAADN